MTFHAIEPLTIWKGRNEGGEAVDFASQSVAHFERQLDLARRQARGQRARIEALQLEMERLREDALQWAEIVDRGSELADTRTALRKLIEKSRGLAAVERLGERLERELAALEAEVRECSAAVRQLRVQLQGPRAASGAA